MPEPNREWRLCCHSLLIPFGFVSCSYYKQPHVADFDKALDLAVTVEEEEAIFAAQKLWASEEARRIKWFKCEMGRGALLKRVAVDISAGLVGIIWSRII